MEKSEFNTFLDFLDKIGKSFDELLLFVEKTNKNIDELYQRIDILVQHETRTLKIIKKLKNDLKKFEKISIN